MLTAFRKFLSHPVFDDEDKSRTARYINSITLASLPILMALFLFRITQGDLPFSFSNLILLSFIVVVTLVWALNRSGAVRMAGYIYIIMIWIASTLLALNGNGVRGTGFISYFVVMLLAGLLLGVRAAMLIVVASIVSGYGMAYAENMGTITVHPESAFGVAAEMTTLFLFSSLFMVLTINSLQNALKKAMLNASELTSRNLKLRELGETLEHHIQERTLVMEKRAEQLQTISDLSRVLTSAQDINTLLPDITRLVRDRFGFYHVGIFLIDDLREYAVLQASNSDSGRQLLTHTYRLQLDSKSVVGEVAFIGEARIVPDVEIEAVYFKDPDLPDTHSEMAIPLSIAGRVIGVFDVQSKFTNAFKEEDIATLTILADQLAIAIENARLFSEAQAALAESERTFDRYIKQEWSTFARQAQSAGYRFDGSRVIPLKTKEPREKAKALAQTGRLSLEKESTEMTVPIRFHGQTMGFLEVKSKKGSRQWTRDEITLLESAAERAALALENARLLETAQRRAYRERAIGEISAKIGAENDVTAIMQAAVEELGRKIGSGTEIMIELAPETSAASNAKST